MDMFQIGRNDHGCSLIGVEAHFDGICDVLGTGVRVVYRYDRYIYLPSLSFALSDFRNPQ